MGSLKSNLSTVPFRKRFLLKLAGIFRHPILSNTMCRFWVQKELNIRILCGSHQIKALSCTSTRRYIWGWGASSCATLNKGSIRESQWGHLWSLRLQLAGAVIQLIENRRLLVENGRDLGKIGILVENSRVFGLWQNPGCTVDGSR